MTSAISDGRANLVKGRALVIAKTSKNYRKPLQIEDLDALDTTWYSPYVH